MIETIVLARVMGPLPGDHGIGQRADLLQLDADGVARLEPHGRLAGHADAVGRSRQDHGAGQERGAAAEELDERRHVEDHVAGVPVLHDLAVEDRLDL